MLGDECPAKQSYSNADTTRNGMRDDRERGREVEGTTNVHRMTKGVYTLRICELDTFLARAILSVSIKVLK